METYYPFTTLLYMSVCVCLCVWGYKYFVNHNLRYTDSGRTSDTVWQRVPQPDLHCGYHTCRKDCQSTAPPLLSCQTHPFSPGVIQHVTIVWTKTFQILKTSDVNILLYWLLIRERSKNVNHIFKRLQFYWVTNKCTWISPALYGKLFTHKHYGSCL